MIVKGGGGGLLRRMCYQRCSRYYKIELKDRTRTTFTFASGKFFRTWALKLPRFSFSTHFTDPAMQTGTWFTNMVWERKKKKYLFSMQYSFKRTAILLPFEFQEIGYKSCVDTVPWQNSATKPSRHWQTGFFSSFEHIPPFLQGFTRQRLRSREN